MQNAITIFGYVIQPVHILAAQFVVLVVFGTFLSFFWRHFKRRWEGRGNRQLDHYLDTVTHASDMDADGFRTLTISNKGMTERVETVIRGESERGWLISAAKNCDWDRRFVKDPRPEQQARVLHVVRNAMTRHFVEGENAHDAREPTKTIDYYFSPTGADATVGGVRMIRNLWVTEEHLKIFASHEVKKWRYEVDKATGKAQDHSVRLQTMREMAEALFKCNGCRDLHGKPVQIIGWMRGRIPV